MTLSVPSSYTIKIVNTPTITGLKVPEEKGTLIIYRDYSLFTPAQVIQWNEIINTLYTYFIITTITVLVLLAVGLG